jgi:hypothetical protein
MDIEHTLTIARNYVIERSHDGISGWKLLVMKHKGNNQF